MRVSLRAILFPAAALLLLAAGKAPDLSLDFLSFSGSESAPAASVPQGRAAVQPGAETTALPASLLMAEPDLPFIVPAADSLTGMVGKLRTLHLPSLDEDTRCLASAVYYESKGEPLDGQLAVAQVILNRVAGRGFGGDICAVVKAPKQFGFVKAGRYTPPERDSQWTTAKAIALIAVSNSWPEIVADATHFHATRVHPGWNLTEVATIGHHVFYR